MMSLLDGSTLCYQFLMIIQEYLRIIFQIVSACACQVWDVNWFTNCSEHIKNYWNSICMFGKTDVSLIEGPLQGLLSSYELNIWNSPFKPKSKKIWATKHCCSLNGPSIYLNSIEIGSVYSGSHPLLDTRVIGWKSWVRCCFGAYFRTTPYDPPQQFDTAPAHRAYRVSCCLMKLAAFCF